MFTLVRDGAMELRAELAEQDLMRLATGQRVVMTGIGWPVPIEGEVRLVEPAIDARTRLGFARIAIPPEAPAVKGMFLTAEILVAEEEQLAVPLTAIGSDGGGTSVMRVRGGVVERVAVTTGIREGALIGVVEGLEPGDLIVTRAGAFVRDGDRINPVPAAPAQEG
jgi:HlyD family secretion protein